MPSAYKEKIAQVPVLAEFQQPLRDHVADIILDIANTRVLKKGEQLYAEGAVDDNTGAILVDGGLIVAYGTHAPILLDPPEMVGEMQQFNKYGTRTATVCARNHATILEFKWHDFVARVQDRPDINHADHARLRDAFTHFAAKRFQERKKPQS
jgi:CRP-like cAMP-binding protein